MPTQVNGTTGVDKHQDGSVTQADLAANVVGNGPAFRAYANSVTSVTPSANKITLDAEVFDSGGMFDTATSRFTPTVAGYYLIGASCGFASTSYVVQARIVKNGTSTTIGGVGVPAGVATTQDLVYLNGSGDYVEMFGYTSTTQNSGGGSTQTYLYGYLVRAV